MTVVVSLAMRFQPVQCLFWTNVCRRPPRRPVASCMVSSRKYIHTENDFKACSSQLLGFLRADFHVLSIERLNSTYCRQLVVLALTDDTTEYIIRRQFD